MSIWPQPYPVVWHQIRLCGNGPMGGAGPAGISDSTVSATFTALRLEYHEVRVWRPVKITHMFVANGTTVNGNIILAIYDRTGRKIADTATVAQAGANSLQFVALNTATMLVPGLYYLAFIPSSSTATGLVQGDITSQENRFLGYAREAQGSHAMPTTLLLDGANAGSSIYMFGASTKGS